MNKLRLLYFLGSLFILNRGVSQNSCQKEANQLFKRVVEITAQGYERASLDEEIKQLRFLHEKKCFIPKDLVSGPDQVGSITSTYFDPLTMEPTDFVRAKNEKLKAALLESKKNPPTCESLKGGIIKKLPPVRDQKSTGWCQYQTLADLFSIELNENISAAYLGALLSSTGSGGTSALAINTLTQKYGLCLESTFRSPGLPERYPTFREWLKNFEERAIRFSRDGHLFPPNEDRLCDYFRDVNKMLGALSFEEMNRIIAQSLIDERVKSTQIPLVDEFIISTGLLSHLALHQCRFDREKLRRDLKVRQYDSEIDNNVPKIHQIIQGNLMKGRPVSVSFNYYSLTQKPERAGGGHYALIVDQRFIGGRCHYLIRNSWGENHCTRLVPQKDACEPGGYFWVDAGKMALETDALIEID